MKNWRRRGDRIVSKVDRHEAAMLRRLVGQVDDLLRARAREAPQDELAELTGIRTGPSSAPDNPILARLLPDFHRLDTEDDGAEGSEGSENTENTERYTDSAAALRSLHEPDLVDAKTAALAALLDALPEDGGTVTLDEQTAASWLAALNDVRLALGTALGVTEDMPERLPADDPRAGQLNVYHWLTWMQDSLLHAMGAP